MDEVDAPKIKTGQPVRISLDALPKQSFPGKVKRVAPYITAVEKQARTVDIEATFDDPAAPGRLLVGYSADVEVILDGRENVVRVPTSALLESSRVLIAGKEGRLEERKIKTGLSNWEFTEVQEGLNAGRTRGDLAGTCRCQGGRALRDRNEDKRQVAFPMATLIELTGIERIFRVGDSEVHALHHLNLAIDSGEYTAVMGPSGSGKSTLLNLLGLLDHPNTGTYRLEGRDVTTLSPEEQARVRSERIGFVFQSFHLVPRLTAAENIALPMTLAGITPDERNQRVKRALADYGLANRARHRPNELSGGQRQRVAIARATIMQPAMILADEPTGNLDRTTGEEVMHLLEELNGQGVTLIVVTHDQALGARARRQLHMEDGELRLDSRYRT